MAKRWLVKSEPSSYSFETLRREKRTVWDGVKNPLAVKHIAQIKKGDPILVYHTGGEKAVVGTAVAAGDAFPDPERPDRRLMVFEIEARAPLRRSVSLAEIKAHPDLRAFPLVRLPRLSVMPVSDNEWSLIMELAGR